MSLGNNQYVVTYRGVMNIVEGVGGAADRMVEVWTESGPDPDIRVDRLVDDILLPITRGDRAVIVTRLGIEVVKRGLLSPREVASIIRKHGV